MSNQPGIPSFDQLAVLVAVVETGSLAAAGRRLHRATSAISYAIDNLEAQLGLPLFTRQATRRLMLTDAGTMVLADARSLARGIDSLRAKVKGLAEGLEAEVSLAVDVMLPTARLVPALTAFQAHFPTVAVRLHVEALGAVPQLVQQGIVTLAVCGPLTTLVEDMAQASVGAVRMLPVAAPGHALAAAGIAAGMAREHLQLVLTDRSPLTQGRDFGVFGLRSWRLADLGSKLALLRAGAGWGFMPEPMVAEDLASGRLVRLHLPDAPPSLYPLTLIHPVGNPPGPAARWLMAELAREPAEAGPTPAPPPRLRA